MDEFIDLESIKLPYVRTDQTLIGPGVWNSNYYDSEELRSAYKRTDWNNKDICSLFLDHADKSVPDWVGFVKNPTMLEDGSVKGDLFIVDKPTAIKLAYGAKFGVSAKVAGLEENGAMRDFRFENFSVVINPACKTSYINNSDNAEKNEKTQRLEFTEDELALVTAMESKRKSMGLSPAQFYAIPRDPPSASKLPIFDAAHCRNAMARFNQVQGVSAEEKASAKRKIIAKAHKFGIDTTGFEGKEDKKMAEEESKPEEPVPEVVEPSSEEQPAEKPAEDSLSEEQPSEEPSPEEPAAEAELSDDELDSLVTDAKWAEFSLACKRKNPKMSFKEIAKSLKAKNERFASYEKMSDEELSEIKSAIKGLMSKRNPKLSQEEEKPVEDVKLLKQVEAQKKEIESLKEAVKSLSDAPDRVTVKSLNAEQPAAEPEAPKYKNGVEAMASFLQKAVEKGGN